MFWRHLIMSKRCDYTAIALAFMEQILWEAYLRLNLKMPLLEFMLIQSLMELRELWTMMLDYEPMMMMAFFQLCISITVTICIPALLSVHISRCMSRIPFLTFNNLKIYKVVFRFSPVASRLGPLKVRVSNNAAFDARQKIKQKKQQQQPSSKSSIKIRIGNNQQKQQQPQTSKPSVKVRIGNNLGQQDARQKIIHKTKFVDARVRIENKKAQTNKTGGNSQPSDMRIKINNAKTKKAQGTVVKQGPTQGATQVTVTGQGRLLTKPGGGVTEVNGSLVKVITQPQHKQPVRVSRLRSTFIWKLLGKVKCCAA